MKRKFIYAITLLLGLSLFSFYAKAQNWQAYKGVWLKGYDNAAQAPLPPLGYSALTYFADSLGTYVYDWDSLAWLRIPGAGGGGGGGGLTTADNGLSVNPAGNVILGGSTLLQNTIVGGGSSIGAATNLFFGTTDDYLNTFNVTAGGEYGLTMGNAGPLNGIFMSVLTNPTSGKRTLFSIPQLNPVSFTIDSLSTSATHNFLIYSDKVVGDIENVRYFTLSPAQTRFNTDRLIINGGTVEMPAITENTNLTDSVMMLDGNGRIFWKTISGGGGGFTLADNGLVSDGDTVRIGTAADWGLVKDLGAVFSTDSLGTNFASFRFSADSVILAHTIEEESNLEDSYVKLQNAHLIGHGENGVDLASNNTQFSLNTNETATLESAAGSTLTMNVANPGLVNLSATGSNAALVMQAEKGFQIFDPGLLVSGDGNNAQLQIGRLSGTGDDGVVRIYYTGRTGEIELGVLAGGPFIRGMEDNRTFRVEAVGANSNIVVKAGSGGFVIMEGLPTTDPCGSAPPGTVWDNSGVLNRCP